MDGKLIIIAVAIVLTTANMQSQKNEAQSATPMAGWPPAPAVKFVASTEKPFEQLMGEAMNLMHKNMHDAEYSGDVDHDFIAMMVPHHQGAIDMAKALLLYGKDPQIRRLAQEIITDQQSEIQLMELWLRQHSAKLQTPSPKARLDARKN